jgi:hypothetical protein
MKNTDYLVYLTTRTGVTTRFARDKEGWVQTAPSGIKRRCTAEQVLNHLLPAMVLGDSVLSTKVKLKQGRRFHPSIERLRKERKHATSTDRPTVLGSAR